MAGFERLAGQAGMAKLTKNMPYPSTSSGQAALRVSEICRGIERISQ